VDCGIRSPVEVAFGNELGLDLIVTDHHSVGGQVPPALACINPKQDDCPYPSKTCRVGLFGLAQKCFSSRTRQRFERRGLGDLVAWALWPTSRRSDGSRSFCLDWRVSAPAHAGIAAHPNPAQNPAR
jgi:hypothetical protein